MKIEDCVPGVRVFYTLYAPKFQGVVRELPWQLSNGTWVTDLIQMEAAYGNYVGVPGKTYVHAASVEDLLETCVPAIETPSERSSPMNRAEALSRLNAHYKELFGERRPHFLEICKALSEPIPMHLWCPQCSAQHIDEGDFATKPHHTHACQKCGLCWRPAVEHTVGVMFLPGFRNEEPQNPVCVPMVPLVEIPIDASSHLKEFYEAEKHEREVCSRVDSLYRSLNLDDPSFAAKWEQIVTANRELETATKRRMEAMIALNSLK